MIAKKEWFKPRVFGWSLRPVTWEGWVYIAIVALIALFPLSLPFNPEIKIALCTIVVIVFLVDSLIVMFQMYRALDERERKHQMIIESSASFAAVLAIVLVALYDSIASGILNIGIFIVLGAMVLAKTIATIYLTKNE